MAGIPISLRPKQSIFVGDAQITFNGLDKSGKAVLFVESEGFARVTVLDRDGLIKRNIVWKDRPSDITARQIAMT